MFANEPAQRTVCWSYQSSPEIQRVANASGSVLVMPIGSIEQHGHHLPVATDSLLAEAVAVGSATRVTDDVPVLVGPTIWSGYSPHHLSLGGTLTASFASLLEYLRGILETAVGNGFESVLLVNGHGGNRALTSALVSELGRNDPKREYLTVTYFDIISDLVDDLRDSDLGGMAHGGEFETSLILHLYPNLVGTEAPATYLDEPYDLGDDDLVAPGQLSVYRPFEAYSESGAIGDPEAASAKKGAELYEWITDELSELLDEISQHVRNEA